MQYVRGSLKQLNTHNDDGVFFLKKVGRDWRVSKSAILRFCLHANTKQSANNFPIPSLKKRNDVGNDDNGSSRTDGNSYALLCSAGDAFDW